MVRLGGPEHGAAVAVWDGYCHRLQSSQRRSQATSLAARAHESQELVWAIFHDRAEMVDALPLS